MSRRKSTDNFEVAGIFDAHQKQNPHFFRARTGEVI